MCTVMFCVVICKCQFFNMVFPIAFKSYWQCFKYVYYCSIHSFSPFPIGSLMPIISDKRLNNLLPNSFPWSCRIRFGNPKSRKYLLNNKSAAALPDLFVPWLISALPGVTLFVQWYLFVLLKYLDYLFLDIANNLK